MAESGDRHHPGIVAHWTREGFAGDGAKVVRSHHTPDYKLVEGPHAPHRLRIHDLPVPDREAADALPLPFMAARSGVQLSVSGRQKPMPFVVANVEADEMHFVQEGELLIETDFGPINANPGDFVCIPRAVQYRVRPVRTPTLTLICEVPGAISLAPPDAAACHVERPCVERRQDPGGETVLLLKTGDGVTRYVKPHDPLAAMASQDGAVPVWKLDFPNNLAACGGPPRHFASSPHNDVLLYNLSARPSGRRPPIHHNADYDELIYFFRGPGAYGSVTEPGMLTWVPKGVAHQGPSEDVPEGYVAWMIESRATLRLTSAGVGVAELMELDTYGPQPASSSLALD